MRGFVRVRTLLALLAALAVAGALACSCGGPPAVNPAPFSDPNAVGYIGLCNQAGQQITSGSLHSVPFAWRAVSSQPARPPYNDDWRTAILLAYQPRQGLAPDEWAGEELTSSSRYTNPAHPMAQATAGDESLADFVSDFPAQWQGFVQLRLYLGTRDAEVYSVRYPALDIEVTGDMWRAVGGGKVDCDAGRAESIEFILRRSSTMSHRATQAPRGGRPISRTSPRSARTEPVPARQKVTRR